MKKPVDPYPVILNLLNRGIWYAPHEVRLQLQLVGCHVSPEATTARMRDLRKPQYGRHCLVKRRRQGTDYFEYRVEVATQKAA
jgi:hypothetical protein